jgi:hypothetical protein
MNLRLKDCARVHAADRIAADVPPDRIDLTARFVRITKYRIAKRLERRHALGMHLEVVQQHPEHIMLHHDAAMASSQQRFMLRAQRDHIGCGNERRRSNQCRARAASPKIVSGSSW